MVRIEHLEADIELRHGIELRACAELVEAVVGVATVTGICPHCREIADEPRERTGAGRSGHQRRIDYVPGGGVVLDAGVAAEPGRLPAWIPDMLVRSERTPCLGQLDLGAVSEYPVGKPAGSDAGRSVVNLGRYLTGAKTDGALRDARVDANHVAAG